MSGNLLVNEDMDSNKCENDAEMKVPVPVPAVVPVAQSSSTGIEASEEAKLKSRYPNINRPMAAHSAFLQKRLAKGQKYFDSGDYQMAKQRPANKSRMPPLMSQSTGEAIPTPESVPVRKTSIIQHSKLTAS